MENTDIKKKKPFFVKLLLGIAIFIGAILLLFFSWMTFCGLQKTQQVKVLPKDYTVYVRTDSAWEAIQPLLDLKAADIVLSDSAYVQFREPLLLLRESEIKNNTFITNLLKRRIDSAIYQDNNFLAVIDMGWLSGISRLAPLVLKIKKIDGLSITKYNGITCISYKLNDNQSFYGTVHKNLVIFSSSKELLDRSTNFSNDEDYTPTEKTYMSAKLDQPFRITADGKKIIDLLGKENPLIQEIGTYISSEQLSSINFGINDESIKINISVPFTIKEENIESPLGKLLARDSKIPSMLSKLPPSVQYYTFITAGSLSQLKDATFHLMSLQGKDIQNKWDSANTVTKLLFNLSIDDLLFSWTGDEYAILGLEGKADPVFVLRISDEEQREKIFDKILSSIILKSNNSLLLDGIRLPRIELPAALNGLLEAMEINLPKPYYMIRDGFIYFSQSPENLAEINAALKSGSKIGRDEKWQTVSDNHTPYSALSLYYNLERSTPFFVKGNSLISQILQLYNIGRVDLGIKDNTFEITLNSAAVDNTSRKEIPGFPVKLEGKLTSDLNKSANPKSHILFWIEDNSILKTFNTASLETQYMIIDDLMWCLPATSNVLEESNGEIWAVTKHGTVYLYNSNLNLATLLPIETHIDFATEPVSYKDGIIACTEDDTLIYITYKGNIKEIPLDIMNQIKAAPSVLDNQVVIYEKGFMGSIHWIENIESDDINYKVRNVDGIAYGSPCVFNFNNTVYTSIITQTGNFYLWDDEQQLVSGFPINLNDIFYMNIQSCNDFLVALSENGILYKINLDGTFTQIQIPHLSAKTGKISITDWNNDKEKEIFVCGEANTIYGFNSDLEFLCGFPVSGYGTPAFIDVNGDKNLDCLVLSIDNHLNAWDIRY